MSSKAVGRRLADIRLHWRRRRRLRAAAGLHAELIIRELGSAASHAAAFGRARDLAADAAGLPGSERRREMRHLRELATRKLEVVRYLTDQLDTARMLLGPGDAADGRAAAEGFLVRLHDRLIGETRFPQGASAARCQAMLGSLELHAYLLDRSWHEVIEVLEPHGRRPPWIETLRFLGPLPLRRRGGESRASLSL